MSVGGAATTLNLGYINAGGVTGAQTINIGTMSSISGAKTVNIGSNSNTGGATSLNVLGGTTSNITVNLGTNATTGTSNINLGSSSAAGGSTVTVGSDLVVGGNFTVNGATTTINATTLTVDDKNIELGSLGASTITSLSGTITNVSGSGPWTADYNMAPANNNIEVGGSFVTTGQSGTSVLYGGSPTSVVVTAVSGAVVTYQVTGGTIPIAGTGNVFSTYYPIVAQSPTDTTADGGGITLKGTSDKTLLWNSTSFGGPTGVWRSSESFSIASSRAYAVADDIVLTKTYLKMYGSSQGSLILQTSASTTDNTLVFPASTQTGVLTNSTSGATGTLSWSASLGTTLGGTGLTSYVTGDLIYASAANTLTARTIGSTGDVLTVSGGVPTWAAPASGTASSITVRRESTPTSSVVRYPIPFLGSNAQNDPSPSFTLTNEGSSTATAYLYIDHQSQTIETNAPANYTNRVSGLFYEVDDDTSNATQVGTLYCDYIGATLDCGSYT